MRISVERLLILLAVLAGSLVGLGFVREVHAAGYAFSIVPSRIQESNVPGVLLSVNVTGATVGQTYKFTWQVTDPLGAVHQASNQTGAGGAPSTFVLSVSYPSQFGTNVNFVGNYTVNVQENNPTNIASVGTGKIQVGLTDATSYQRTFTVSVKARGYANNSPVAINISHDGTSAPGYPAILSSSGSGTVSTSWVIPPGVPTGTWTLSLSGGPAKPVADVQNFTVYPTNVTISQLNLGKGSLEKTETQSFFFTANYLGGIPVQTGSGVIRITEPDGTTILSTTASYNSSRAEFSGGYRVLPGDQDGAWVAAIDPLAFGDGYGNGGPSASVVRAFTVRNATLSVGVSISNQTYTIGQAIPVYATVSFPDGSTFTNGTVTASFSSSGTRFKNSLPFTYIAGQSKWALVYTVGPNDPSGLWIVTVEAADLFGNAGQQTSSSVVSVPPSTPPPAQGLVSSSFLLIAVLLAVATGGLAFLLARRRGKTGEMRLDLRVVDSEAGRIQGGEFFQSVKKQVDGEEPPRSDPASPKGRGGESSSGGKRSGADE